MTKEARQLALEALKLTWESGMPHPNIMQVGAAIEALELLTEQQEPVAWMTEDGEIYKHECWPELNPRPLVLGDTSPPQRTWVGLTDEEIEQLWYEFHDREFGWAKQFARVIEAKLKEKTHD